MRSKSIKPVITLTGIIAALAVLLTFVITPNASAAETAASATTSCTSVSIDLTQEQQATLDKIVSVGEYYRFNGETLSIDLTREQLENNFGFTQADYEFLQHQVLDVANGKTGMAQRSSADLLYGRMAAKCNGAYLSYYDLTTGFAVSVAAAAQAGPDALAAALTAISGMLRGPVGAALGAGVSVIGIAFFASTAVKIIGAIAQHKGVCFTGSWDFPFVRADIV